jgi:hypothetical protein
MKHHRRHREFVCAICKHGIEGERGYKPWPYPGELCCTRCFDEKVLPALQERERTGAMSDLPEGLRIRMIDTIVEHCEDEKWVDRFTQRRRAYLETFAAELLADQQKNGEPVVAPADE